MPGLEIARSERKIVATWFYLGRVSSLVREAQDTEIDLEHCSTCHNKQRNDWPINVEKVTNSSYGIRKRFTK